MARVYDYLLGGRANFAVTWAAAASAYAAWPGGLDGVRADAQAMAEAVTLRGRDEVAGLFGGLELVEPGVVQLPQWRPEAGTEPAGPLPMWCGVARKVS